MEKSNEKEKELKKEKEWLEYTKEYMHAVIEEALLEQGKLQEDVKHAIGNIEALDSSLGYIDYLTNSRFLQQATSELSNVKRLLNAPYFARIDYQINGKSNKNSYYLGKTSLYEKDTQKPIIVDWRSPIANVYYDGRLGEVSYQVNEETIEGYLSLKRQYKIEKGELLGYQDIDLKTTDDLLQEALAGKADQRLTEIITTIQAEQNEVIRADLNCPLIVQGAAGSGKTTIALHRISYFIYHYAHFFRPEQLMIIAPNNMFIDYIAEALPDLGVEKIRQTTYIEYVQLCIGKKIQVIHANEKLLSLVKHQLEKEEMVKWAARFKGSLMYKNILDTYLLTICDQMSPKEEFRVERFPLYGAKKLERLFKQDFSYLPLAKRKEKIKGILQADLKRKKKLIIQKLIDKYEAALDRALVIKKDDVRKKKVVYLLDTKEERLKHVRKETTSAVRKYMKGMPVDTLLGYYQTLFSSIEQFSIYAGPYLTKEQIAFFVPFQQTMLKTKKVEVDDLAALFYLQYRIFGIDKEIRAKNIVIDEVQDYSEFQLYALKVGLETDRFTLVGDLAQGIHSYRGLQQWSTLREDIFPRANYMTLQKSYRTTIEIMNTANQLLQLLNETLPLVKPVVRHGLKPIFHAYKTKKECIQQIITVIENIYKQNYRSIAIIGKTDTDCQTLYKTLKKQSLFDVHLLKEQEELKKNMVVIVPTYLSKGLEFDAVLIPSLDEKYQVEELDIKLLYVAMTRPMHILHFFARDTTDLLLNHINKESYLKEGKEGKHE